MNISKKTRDMINQARERLTRAGWSSQAVEIDGVRYEFKKDNAHDK